MKTIIAGSRTVTNYDTLKQAVKESGFEITEIVSGGARGADSLGEKYAKENNIPMKIFPAEWDKHGKAAGYIRNEQMAEYVGEAGQLIALHLNESRGTAHMISLAKKNGLKIFVKKVE